MGFDKGSFALTLFRLPQRLPKDAYERFAALAAQKIDLVSDEISVGWVTGRHILENEILEETAYCGGYLNLCLRVAERKIPAPVLNALVRRRELLYMQEQNTTRVPSNKRKEFRAEAIDENLKKMFPTLAGVPFVIDDKAGLLYLGTASAKQMDTFVSLFLKTLEFEPFQITLQEMMLKLFKKELIDLPGIAFSEESDPDEMTPERDFLTWLWYHCETADGNVDVPELGRFSIIVDGPLSFSFAADDAKGSGETTVRKGCPVRSAEAKAALGVGKKLKKAKITLARNQEVWAGTFDADRYTFSGFNLPEGEEMEFQSRFAERIDRLQTFQIAMESYFRLFAETLLAKDWKKTEKKIQQWVKDKDSL
jgi:hypothetical protein